MGVDLSLNYMMFFFLFERIYNILVWSNQWIRSFENSFIGKFFLKRFLFELHVLFKRRYSIRAICVFDETFWSFYLYLSLSLLSKIRHSSAKFREVLGSAILDTKLNFAIWPSSVYKPSCGIYCLTSSSYNVDYSASMIYANYDLLISIRIVSRCEYCGSGSRLSL